VLLGHQAVLVGTEAQAAMHRWNQDAEVTYSCDFVDQLARDSDLSPYPACWQSARHAPL
jgi:hypothetical protein